MTYQWGAGVGVSPSLSPGSMLLAIFEAVSSQIDFLQAQALQIVNLSRAATSTGGDLDTWMAQFNFARLGAAYATGPVQLIRYTPASSTIGVSAATLDSTGAYTGGALVQTVGGAVVYQVIPDVLQSAYNATSNSYQFPIGSSSITVTAQALYPGASYNVAAGTLTQLGSTSSGVDTCNNSVAILDGADAESDNSFRARFVLYLSTLAEATESAIMAAAQVQQGLNITPAENTTPTGTAQLGCFTLFADNGTGSPPQSLLNTIYAAVNAVRAFSVQPYVSAPSILNASIVLAIRVAAGYTLGGLQPAVVAAVVAVTETLASGATLYANAVAAAAASVPGVTSVQAGLTINGFAADLVPSAYQEIRSSTALVTVGSY